jgi:2-haloacid dehalogenase
MDGIEAVAFDLYGTLLEVASVGRAAAEVTGEPAALVDLWRQKQLEYTWLRSLMGRYQDFWATTGDALDYALDRLAVVVDEATRARLLGAWLDVRPYPEVPDALDALALGGRRLAVLSNGTPDMLEAGLAAAGLRDRFEHVLSVDDLGVFKPHPSVYELALKAFNLAAERILFVSSNAWDAFGARAFGLPVAWVNRSGAPLERLGAPPTVVVPDLAALAEAVG